MAECAGNRRFRRLKSEKKPVERRDNCIPVFGDFANALTQKRRRQVRDFRQEQKVALSVMAHFGHDEHARVAHLMRRRKERNNARPPGFREIALQDRHERKTDACNRQRVYIQIKLLRRAC